MTVSAPHKPAAVESPSSYGPATTGPLNPEAFPRLVTPPKPQITGFVQPRTLAVVEAGLTPGCAVDDAKYNEGVSTWMADAEKLTDSKRHACDGPETVTVDVLRSRRDKIEALELSLSQRAVTLCRDYVGRAEARTGELKTYAETCDDELVETEKSVVAKLQQAGVTIESQPAYRDNIEAAKITFRHLVQGSTDWKAADAKATNARNNHQATVESVTAGKARVVEAEKHLATVVKRLAGI